MPRTLAAVCLLFLVVFPSSLAAQQPSKAFHFALEIPGTVMGTFQAVEGLTSENEVIEFREGGESGPARKVPGRLKYGNVTLKRGVSSDKSLAMWRKLVEDGSAGARKNGSIVLYDRANKEIARWNFVNGWPSKLSIDQDPESGEVVETIVLAVEVFWRP